MKLAGWQKRLEEQQAKVDRLEASGEMAEMYKYNRKRFAKLYQRLGYLKQRVETLTQIESLSKELDSYNNTETESDLWVRNMIEAKLVVLQAEVKS